MSINLASPINWSHPLNRGLVARYITLPVFRGNQWRDSAKGNHGTLTNAPTWQPGRNNTWGSLRLVGASNQSVFLPDRNYGIASGFTLAVWHYGNINELGSFLGRDDSGGERFWQFRKTTDPHVASFIRFDAGGSVVTNITGTTALISNVWRRVLATFTGTGSFIYVNGTQEASDAVTTANLDGTGTIPAIGCRSGEQSTSEPITAYLDDVCFWNRGFTATDALLDYREGLLGYPTVLNRIQPVYGKIMAGGGGAFDPATGFAYIDQTHQIRQRHVVVAY